jgi:VanZ family protein
MRAAPATSVTWQGRLLWAAWWTVFLGWFVALVTSQPAQVAQGALPERAINPTSSALHVAAYVVLTALTLALPASARVRWLLVAAVVLHALVSEYLQQFIPLRVSSVEDAVCNLAGVGAGAVLWAAVRRALGRSAGWGRAERVVLDGPS